MIDSPLEPVYQETLDYLYSFIDFSMQRQFLFSPEKFDLGRMRVLTAALGNPEQKYPVIHIAGTKGKGSVASLCASVLQASGYRVGLYTSPHLEDYNERIQVNGVPIPHMDLVSIVNVVKPILPSIPEITTFEITTALAFLYFAKQNVDAAVIEVGLGGRLDATNIVSPLLTVITSLSYDHMEILGETLALIAGEKAGIIKDGRPVVVSPQQPEALEVVEAAAAQRSAPLTLVGRDYRFAYLSHSLENQTFKVWQAPGENFQTSEIGLIQNPPDDSVELSVPLLGRHQVENAATAYAALQVGRELGLRIEQQNVRDGFANVKWPGRFELLRQTPPVVVDSAHNRDSAQRLRMTIEEYLPEWPVILLVGASEDKDIRGMFDELMPVTRQVITTKSIHPRAADPAFLGEMAEKYGKPAVPVSLVEDALEIALNEAGSHAAVVATGSIFLAAAVRSAWQKRNEHFPVTMDGDRTSGSP
jgi:dihydrofolate synthase / folylpolyglutamate synthase